MKQLYLCSLIFFFFIFSAFNTSKDTTVSLDILGVWTVNLIDLSDCELPHDNLVLDLRFSKCFEQVKDDYCIQMLMDFKEDGSLIQTFKTIRNGKLIDDKKEYCYYTISNSKITICARDGSFCEKSNVEVFKNELIISGRDVVDQCNLVLKSTK